MGPGHGGAIRRFDLGPLLHVIGHDDGDPGGCQNGVCVEFQQKVQWGDAFDPGSIVSGHVNGADIFGQTLPIDALDSVG